MPLSWNEIRDRAFRFQNEWKDAEKERSEAQSFYNELFAIFGVSRRRVATFEKTAKTLKNTTGSIDLLWKGVLLAEHKSRGKDLEKAYAQALDYCQTLKPEEHPRYILISDFENLHLYDLEKANPEKDSPDKANSDKDSPEKANPEKASPEKANPEKANPEKDRTHKFKLKDFSKNIKLFGFIAGYKEREYQDQDPVNIEAAELMGELYDEMTEANYQKKDLDILLVRILFCLFAENTEIFSRDEFKIFIEEKTQEDGSDLGSQLQHLFEILNKEENKRQTNLDEQIANFPYVNGELFEKKMNTPAFNSRMRSALLKCCNFDWSKISPAIFGSLFQSVADKIKRRSLGEHYTSEKNILKTIDPLFLDELKEEFKKVKNNPRKLAEFHLKLARLKFLDPACGCGNFLIIAYREIRKLEIEVLRIQNSNKNTRQLDIAGFSKIDVDNFYGIEIEEYPAEIATVGLWLMDHLMNLELSKTFGGYFARIPLKKKAEIIKGNALQLCWKSIIPPEQLSYILGNPPFIGKAFITKEQNADMDLICQSIKGAGVLDYVTAWYFKAAAYIQNTKIKVGFVSTNSISQGEQTAILWHELLHKYKIKIGFAHRTFAWDSEAAGKANVHVVIIGFAIFDATQKRLFDYEDPKGEPYEIAVKNINPYLLEGKNILITKRSKPISNIPEIKFGSMPNDNGNFLFTDKEKKEFVKKEPQAKNYFRPLLSSREYLNAEKRWCLWLLEADPKELKTMPLVLQRIEAVKKYRLASNRKTTQELAQYPALFGEIRQPNSSFLLIPLVSSERRKYVPISLFSKNYIANNSCSIVSNATLYHFGIITSEMHMVWMKYTCGRLESRYRYSNKIVYNNFPFPQEVSDAKKEKIKQLAQAVLDARKEFPDNSLADIYDPNTMPAKLVKAHNSLDRAVDSCYSKKKFANERERIEFLFGLYHTYTIGMQNLTKK